MTISKTFTHKTATKRPVLTALHCIFVIWITSLAQHGLASELSLNGLAVFEKLRKEYYIGALYLETDSKESVNFAGKKRMEMLISAAKWTPRRFSREWNQAIFLNNDQELLAGFTNEIKAFTDLPKGSLVAGDRITIDMDPSLGTTVYVNGIKAFSVADRKYFDVLLNVWVGKRPPSSDFKSHILTLSIDQPGLDLLARFQSDTATELRTKEIAGWFNSKPTANKSKRVAEKKVAKPAQQVAKAKKPKVETLKPTIETAKLPSKAVALLAVAEQKKPTHDMTTLNSHIKAQLKTADATKEADALKAQQALKDTYGANLLTLTYLNTVYPAKSIKHKQRGKVNIKVKINRKGEIISMSRALSSKHKRLNKAATKAVERTAPFPEPPKELLGENFEFILPFNFKL